MKTTFSSWVMVPEGHIPGLGADEGGILEGEKL